MEKREFIYRVKFHQPPFHAKHDFRTDFFFASLEAIYTVFAPEQIGCKVERLWKLHVSDGNAYQSSLCEIVREPLVRKPQAKRGRKSPETDE